MAQRVGGARIHLAHRVVEARDFAALEQLIEGIGIRLKPRAGAEQNRYVGAVDVVGERLRRAERIFQLGERKSRVDGEKRRLRIFGFKHSLRAARAFAQAVAEDFQQRSRRFARLHFQNARGTGHFFERARHRGVVLYQREVFGRRTLAQFLGIVKSQREQVARKRRDQLALRRLRGKRGEPAEGVQWARNVQRGRPLDGGNERFVSC